MDTKKEHRAHAEGSPRGNPYDLTYSPSGRLIEKYRNNHSVTTSATVDMYYGYCNDYQPHAVKRMFDHENGLLYDMRWDEAGNLGQVSMAKLGEMFERGRFLFWTEDCCGCEHRLCQSNVVSNRMHAAVDEKYFSYYVYDHSGERRLKLTGENKQQDVNADLMATYTVLNEPTLYPSPYMVLNNKGYTKHYYAGTERVAARLGSGGLDALQPVIASDEDLQWKADQLFKQSLDHVNHRVLGENDLDCITNNEYAREEFGKWIDGIPYQVRSDVAVDNGQFKEMVNSMLDDPNNGKEKEVYFYHSDHLGGASWITDVNGKPVQHLQYLPFGEPYINQRPFGYSERFTFTGKERDEETGYGYFGARYMDYELLTSFLSVDRYASKYPSISPYVYCAWNPIVLTDPSGDTIINKYLQYKDSKGYGGELYARTQKLIDEFQTSHPEEFEYLNNLSFENEDGKCTPINIMIGISDEKGPKSPETGTRKQGLTAYEFDYEPVVYCDEKGKYTYKLNVVGIKDNKISITLFQRHHDIGTLANEFGDAIFVVLRPQTVYDERKLGYFRKATTNFSFHYEAFIKGERATCPNPFDLDEY